MIRFDATLLDLLRSGQAVRFTVSGDSMSPAIRTGDRVVVEPSQESRVGTVVVRHHENRVLVHRLIAVEGDGITTRGDAMFRSDPPAPVTSIVGVVRTVERGSGTFAPPQAPSTLMRIVQVVLRRLHRRR